MKKNICFVFDTEAEAVAAAEKCDDGLSAKLIAAQADNWAVPEQRLTDNKWYFKQPNYFPFTCDECTVKPKCHYTEENMDKNWNNKNK